MKSEEENYDFIVGFTIFAKSEYKTMHRHFSSLERAQRFASNVNIKDNHKIYVDYDLYQKEKEKNEKLERYKRIANQKLDDIEEFRKNECNHRCIKDAELKEFKEYIFNNYISKDKIRDKISELEFERKDLTVGSFLIDAQIGVLKRLLEENNGKQM